jgi:hypothetical protein
MCRKAFFRDIVSAITVRQNKRWFGPAILIKRRRAMVANSERRVVRFALALGLGIAAANAVTAVAQGPVGKLSRKTYNVRSLVRGESAANIEHLIVSTVEPRTWMMMAGPGNIEVQGRHQLVIIQTAAVHKKVAELLAALGKLPAVQKPRSTRSPTKPSNSMKPPGETTRPAKPPAGVKQIPIGKQDEAGQTLMVYDVHSLLDTQRSSDFEILVKRVTSTVAPKTWEEGGGSGILQIYPRGRAIVVLQSKKVHAGLFKMLKEMHRQKTVGSTAVGGGAGGGTRGGS